MRYLYPGLVLAIFSCGVLADWTPQYVDVWDPAFNTDKKHHEEKYIPLSKAAKKWNLCVVIPHLKDAYWMAVNYGLVEQAKQLGVVLTIKAAGGYDKLEQQRKQVEQCLAEDADALILGAIKSNGLNDLIKTFAAKGKPVIDLINGIDSPDLTARTAADYFEMGKAAGEYVARATDTGKTIQVGWLPGPKGAGWSEAGNLGFQSGLAGKPMEIVATEWGDTGLSVQSKLIIQMLDTHPDIEFIAGTAVSAEAAVQVLRRRKLSDSIKVISYYFSPSVHRGIQREVILASLTDNPGLQARLSVDVAVRALEKKPYIKHLSAAIQLIDRNNVNTLDLSGSLAPEGFRAILSVNR